MSGHLPVNIPAWKRWLSYLLELPLEQTTSKYNPHLEVTLADGRFKLNASTATYSFADKYAVFRDAFEILDIGSYELNDVLVLGFGLGSVPILLRKHGHTDARFVGVDIDTEIIRLARKYLPEEVLLQCELIAMNARAFIRKTSDQYDLIIIDIFEDHVVPEVFETQKFLESLKPHLKKNGMVLFNRLTNDGKSLTQTIKVFKEHFKAVFPKGRMLELQGNRVLVG